MREAEEEDREKAERRDSLHGLFPPATFGLGLRIHERGIFGVGGTLRRYARISYLNRSSAEARERRTLMSTKCLNSSV